MMETLRGVLIFSAVVAVVSGNHFYSQNAVNKLCMACQEQKVYFHVSNVATMRNITAGTIIEYDKVLTNQGSGYNQTTGTFTAPRDGPYVFTWTAVTLRMHRINLLLVVEGKLESVAQADGFSGSSNGSGSNTVVVELKRGDNVYVKCGDWENASQQLLYGYAHSSFSGWAI